MGETLDFSFDITSLKPSDQKLAIDYKIHYVKKSGQQTPKVFKLKELMLAGEQSATLSKSQTFKDFTTRKHYAGVHAVEIMINGTSMARSDFDLLIP